MITRQRRFWRSEGRIMSVIRKVAGVAALGIVFAAAVGPAAQADVQVFPDVRTFTGCPDTGQPGLLDLVVNEPSPVPGGRAGFIRFTATFNRVVPQSERVCFRFVIAGSGLRVRGESNTTVNLHVQGQGTNTISFSQGGLTRTGGLLFPRGVRTTLMTAPGVGTITAQQVNAFGVGLAGSTVRTLQVQVAATPRPVLTLTRPVLLAGQVGEGTIALPFTLADDLALQTLVSDTGSPQRMTYRPVAGGAYVPQFMYRVENGAPTSARFYYKAPSALTQSQMISFQYTANGAITPLTSPRVTVNPVPNCGARTQVFQLQPDGTRVADCFKAQIQPLPFKN